MGPLALPRGPETLLHTTLPRTPKWWHLHHQSQNLLLDLLLNLLLNLLSDPHLNVLLFVSKDLQLSWFHHWTGKVALQVQCEMWFCSWVVVNSVGLAGIFFVIFSLVGDIPCRCWITWKILAGGCNIRHGLNLGSSGCHELDCRWLWIEWMSRLWIWVTRIWWVCMQILRLIWVCPWVSVIIACQVWMMLVTMKTPPRIFPAWAKGWEIAPSMHPFTLGLMSEVGKSNLFTLGAVLPVIWLVVDS